MNNNTYQYKKNLKKSLKPEIGFYYSDWFSNQM